MTILAATAVAAIAPAQARGLLPDPYEDLPETCLQPGAVVFEGATYLTWEPNFSRFSVDAADLDFEFVVGASYAVTLVSYDNHPKDDTQLQEMWLVELLSDAGDPVYTSSPTGDLPSDTEWAEYEIPEPAVIDSPIASVWAIHALEGQPQVERESVWAVCAVFEQVDEPPRPSIDIEKATNLQDADAAPGPEVVVGDPVEWSYVVTNTGDVPLTNVVVTDDQGVAVACPSDLLAPDEVMTCTGSGTAVAGQYANTGTVTATGPWGQAADDMDLSHYLGVVVEVDLEKATNGVDADESPGPVIVIGEQVEWSYVVTNTGDVALLDVVVSDDQGVDVVCPFSSLAPGATMTCTGSGTAIEGQYANVGTVLAASADGVATTDADESHYLGVYPGIAIEKATNGADADDPLGADVPTLLPGESVTWTFQVTNTGTVPLTDVEVVDDKLGVVPGPLRGDVNGDGALDVAEVWEYEVTGFADDLAAALGTVDGCADGAGNAQPTHVNTAIATAAAGEVTPSDVDQSHYCNADSQPRREVVLSDQITGRNRLFDGDPFEFVVYVANLGDQPTDATSLELRLRGRDAQWVRLPGVVESIGTSAAAGCGVRGASMVVPGLEPGEIVECIVPAQVIDGQVNTVIGQVWEVSSDSGSDELRDEEPVLLVGWAVSGLALAAEASPVAVNLGGVLADAQQIRSVSGRDTAGTGLPTTGVDADRLLLLSLLLLLAGSTLVVAGRPRGSLKPGRAAAVRDADADAHG